MCVCYWLLGLVVGTLTRIPSSCWMQHAADSGGDTQHMPEQVRFAELSVSDCHVAVQCSLYRVSDWCDGTHTVEEIVMMADKSPLVLQYDVDMEAMTCQALNYDWDVEDRPPSMSLESTGGCRHFDVVIRQLSERSACVFYGSIPIPPSYPACS
jgi:hypothetical protein